MARKIINLKQNHDLIISNSHSKVLFYIGKYYKQTCGGGGGGGGGRGGSGGRGGGGGGGDGGGDGL
jgi:uncharacterized membrane protein